MKPKRTVKMSLRKPAAPRRSAPAPARARDADMDYEIEDCEAEAEPNMRFSHALFVVLVLHVIAVAGVFAFNSIKARQMEENSAKAADKSPAPAAAFATPAPSSAPEPAAPKPRRIHTVAAGETLSRIASRYGSSVAAIAAANGIASTSLLRIGQELVIPGPGERPPAQAPERKKPALATVVASARPAEVPRPAAQKPAGGVAASAAPAPAASPASARATPPSAQPPAAAPAPPAAAPARPADGVVVVAKGDNPYSIAKRYGVSYKKLLEINGIEDPTRVPVGRKLKLPPAP